MHQSHPSDPLKANDRAGAWRLARWSLAAALVVLAFAVFALWRFLGPLPNLNHVDERQPAPASRILDRNGQLLYEVIDPARGSYQPVPLDQIPAFCRQATVATEDQRFYQHPGIDPIAIVRAAWADWRHGATIQGGSTLTQQLARLLLLDEKERYEHSLRRKLREAVLAWRLERLFSKDELLALYLNSVYYGHYASGIEAAANAYFGRHAAELDLAQCALLAGLPQSPNAYNPIENPEAATTRQRQVLDLMMAAGDLDSATAGRAAAEPLHFAASPFPIAAPHLVFFVQSQLEAAVGHTRLAQGNLRITTTADLALTQQAETMLRRRLDELNRPSPNLPLQRRAENAALVALDPRTGAVVVLVGSPDYFDDSASGALNGALVQRQPGSAMKPITYAVAMDPELSTAAGRRPMTPASVLADVPGSFLTREGDYYEPLNYDLAFHGPVSLRQALANSYNIPAVRTLEAIGIDAFLEQSRRHGISTLGPGSQYGLALTLGGGEVTLLELTSAYAPFVDAGRPLLPLAISRIEDADGQLLFDAGLDGPVYNPQHFSLPTVGETETVLDPRTAYLITSILSDNDARARTFGFSSALRIDRPAAAKTGTTTDWRDNWTIGYTPDLLTGVWVGNADNTPMYGATGVDGAAPIWHDFMLAAHRNLPPRSFVRPDGLVDRDVCVPSGLLASSDCPQVAREAFIAGTEPDQRDDQYRRLAIDPRTGQPATAETPAAVRRYRVAWNPPPIFRDWARQNGLLLANEALPEAPVQASAHGATLQVLSPEPNATYLADSRLLASSQKLQLAIAYTGGEPLNQVSYMLDGVPVAVTEAWPWTAWWSLSQGRHSLQALARTHSGNLERSEIVIFTVE